MSVQHYSEGSLIDRATIIKTPSGGMKAYLRASSHALPEQLSSLTQHLHKEGWQALRFTREGEPVLEVCGFKDGLELSTMLRRQNMVTGNPKLTHMKPSKSEGFWEMFRRSTLKLSGFLFFLSDFAYFTYGYQKGSKEDMAAGFAYFGGSLSLFIGGNSDRSRYELRDVSKKMLRFLLHSGVEVPSTAALYDIANSGKQDALTKVNDLLHTYPAEIMNSFFGLAGLCIARGAQRELASPTLKEHDRLSKQMNMGLGLTTLTSGLISTMVKEKAPDLLKKKSTGLAAILDWVREKPLRVAGYGYLVSSLIHAVSTYKEYHNAKLNPTDPENAIMLKSVPFRIIFVACTLMAELLVAISSKGHGEGIKTDKAMENSAYALAADLIAKQPTHRREILVDQLAGFLAHPEIIGGKVDQIAGEIRKQLGGMLKSPWSQVKELHQNAVAGAKSWVERSVAPDLSGALAI